MTLSRQSIEILLDLLEIKVNAIEVQDKDDARELNRLKKCRKELSYIHSQIAGIPKQKALEQKPLHQRVCSKRYSSGEL